MMRCLLYANGEAMGSAEFTACDTGMGCATAAFHPADGYSRIQPVIREFTKRSSDVSGVARTEVFEEARLRVEALNLTVRTVDGDLLRPEGINLLDFSDELEEDPYELSLLGLPRETVSRYFEETDTRR